MTQPWLDVRTINEGVVPVSSTFSLVRRDTSMTALLINLIVVNLACFLR